jgi:hypothetical protein
MTLGRTSTGAIKIKTDTEGGGLRAVECACCGCNPIYTTTLGPFLHGSISDLWSKEKLDAWANSPFTVNIGISVMGRSASLSVTAPVVCKYDNDSTYADYFNDWETVLGPVCDDDPECGNYYKYESLDMTLIASRVEGYKYETDGDPVYGLQSKSLGEGQPGSFHFDLYVAYDYYNQETNQSGGMRWHYFYANAISVLAPNSEGLGFFTPPVRRLAYPDATFGDFVFYEYMYRKRRRGSSDFYPDYLNVTVTRP